MRSAKFKVLDWRGTGFRVIAESILDERIGESDSPDSTKPLDASSVLIDYCDPLRNRTVINFIVLMVTFGLTAIVLSILGALLWPGNATVSVISMILPALIVGHISWRAIYGEMNRARRIVKQEADRDIPAMLRRYFAPSRLQLAASARGFARALATEGYSGKAIRVLRKELPTAIMPLTHAFEPIPLDETVSAFLALEETSPIPRSGHLFQGGAGNIERDASQLRRRIQRNLNLGGGRLLAAFLGIMAAIQWIGAYQAGRVRFMDIVFTFNFLVIIFGIGGRGAWREGIQWFLVPGGVVVRRVQGRAKAWALHYFQQPSSVLMTRNFRQQSWEVCVADGDRHQTVFITERELTMLLRAWLSPLPPPALERLSDLV